MLALFSYFKFYSFLLFMHLFESNEDCDANNSLLEWSQDHGYHHGVDDYLAFNTLHH